MSIFDNPGLMNALAALKAKQEQEAGGGVSGTGVPTTQRQQTQQPGMFSEGAAPAQIVPAQTSQLSLGGAGGVQIENYDPNKHGMLEQNMPGDVGPMPSIYGDRSYDTTVYGSSPKYQQHTEWGLDSRPDLTGTDYENVYLPNRPTFDTTPQYDIGPNGRAHVRGPAGAKARAESIAGQETAKQDVEAWHNYYKENEDYRKVLSLDEQQDLLFLDHLNGDTSQKEYKKQSYDLRKSFGLERHYGVEGRDSHRFEYQYDVGNKKLTGDPYADFLKNHDKVGGFFDQEDLPGSSFFQEAIRNPFVELAANIIAPGYGTLALTGLRAADGETLHAGDYGRVVGSFAPMGGGMLSKATNGFISPTIGSGIVAGAAEGISGGDLGDMALAGFKNIAANTTVNLVKANLQGKPASMVLDDVLPDSVAAPTGEFIDKVFGSGNTQGWLNETLNLPGDTDYIGDGKTFDTFEEFMAAEPEGGYTDWAERASKFDLPKSVVDMMDNPTLLKGLDHLQNVIVKDGLVNKYKPEGPTYNPETNVSDNYDPVQGAETPFVDPNELMIPSDTLGDIEGLPGLPAIEQDGDGEGNGGGDGDAEEPQVGGDSDVEEPEVPSETPTEEPEVPADANDEEPEVPSVPSQPDGPEEPNGPTDLDDPYERPSVPGVPGRDGRDGRDGLSASGMFDPEWSELFPYTKLTPSQRAILAPLKKHVQRIR